MQQQLAKEMKLVAALKQHYERYHAEDLAALKELYEYHAKNCVKAAELTEDTRSVRNISSWHANGPRRPAPL